MLQVEDGKVLNYNPDSLLPLIKMFLNKPRYYLKSKIIFYLFFKVKRCYEFFSHSLSRAIENKTTVWYYK